MGTVHSVQRFVHEECADIGFALTFTCQNCNSDDSDYAY